MSDIDNKNKPINAREIFQLLERKRLVFFLNNNKMKKENQKKNMKDTQENLALIQYTLAIIHCSIPFFLVSRKLECCNNIIARAQCVIN